jgi:HipA-like protein
MQQESMSLSGFLKDKRKKLKLTQQGLAEKNWKLNAKDRMGLLLSCCKDCIGAVSIVEDKT